MGTRLNRFYPNKENLRCCVIHKLDKQGLSKRMIAVIAHGWFILLVHVNITPAPASMIYATIGSRLRYKLECTL